MPFEIQMPHVGESVTEAVIEKWLKSPGDRIEKYEPIVEVVTDKVAMEVPAPRSGELTRIIAAEGETVPMGAAIAEMISEDGDVEETSGSETVSPEMPREVEQSGRIHRGGDERVEPVAGLQIADASQIGSMITAANVGPTGGAFSDTSLGEPSPVEGTISPSEATGKKAATGPGFARLSPAVRRLLEEHGLDAADVAGSGVGGRITRADVLKTVEGRGSADGLTSTSPGTESGVLRSPSAIRRMIADHMSKSFREIPHAWSAIEVDVSGLVACRKSNVDSVQSTHAVKLTYLPFALGITASALKRNPLLNASWREDGILLHGEVNVGIAVAGKEGLVVPVVRKADGKSVIELAKELSSVVERARNGKLSLNDVSGGTFTLNNTGALGSVWGGAIINHPQAAILTTEAIVRRPIVNERDEVEVRPMMNICLSFDHRVIDGAEASEFLQDVKNGIESISAETVLE